MFPPKPEVSKCLIIVNEIVLFQGRFRTLLQTLSKICQQGFDDARLFLQQNNLVACYQCISTIPASERNLSDIDCLECETQKQVCYIFLKYLVVFELCQDQIAKR